MGRNVHNCPRAFLEMPFVRLSVEGLAGNGFGKPASAHRRRKCQKRKSIAEETFVSSTAARRERALSGLRHTLEEINDAGLQGILGAHNEDPFSLN